MSLGVINFETMKWLVISKTKQISCFKNISVDGSPITWLSNRKSWMMSGISTDWIKDMIEKYNCRKDLFYCFGTIRYLILINPKNPK